MKNKGKNLKGYNSYLKEYRKLQTNMTKMGYTMAEGPYSPAEYKTMANALKADRQLAVDKGERKLVGNLNRDLAKKQQWTMSNKQANVISKAIAKQQGLAKSKAPNIKAVRSGSVKFDWDALYAEGMTEAEIKQEYFGS